MEDDIMPPHISILQRDRSGTGNLVDLPRDPYFNTDENIYWTQTDTGGGIDQSNAHWMYKELTNGYCGTLEVQGGPTQCYANLPVDSLDEGYYMIIGRVPDLAQNFSEIVSLVIVDKTPPNATDLWCLPVWTNAQAVLHSSDVWCYTQIIELSPYGIDEVTSEWGYRPYGVSGTYTPFPDLQYFYMYCSRWASFTFPVQSQSLSGQYQVRGLLRDKAGNLSSPVYFLLTAV
jgi:hypothetical protein